MSSAIKPQAALDLESFQGEGQAKAKEQWYPKTRGTESSCSAAH